mmetsp:Transcript_42450/g.113581  ORF Transcript_42450/g.113581 Transcript_42450/m.113581 type:complete len:112 (-) Transcript_42450:55-390(-)
MVFRCLAKCCRLLAKLGDFGLRILNVLLGAIEKHENKARRDSKLDKRTRASFLRASSSSMMKLSSADVSSLNFASICPAIDAGGVSFANMAAAVMSAFNCSSILPSPYCAN